MHKHKYYYVFKEQGSQFMQIYLYSVDCTQLIQLYELLLYTIFKQKNENI